MCTDRGGRISVTQGQQGLSLSQTKTDPRKSSVILMNCSLMIVALLPLTRSFFATRFLVFSLLLFSNLRRRNFCFVQLFAFFFICPTLLDDSGGYKSECVCVYVLCVYSNRPLQHIRQQKPAFLSVHFSRKTIPHICGESRLDVGSSPTRQSALATPFNGRSERKVVAYQQHVLKGNS